MLTRHSTPREAGTGCRRIVGVEGFRMLEQVKRWVPAPIRRVVHDRRDEQVFRRLPRQRCAAQALAPASAIDLERMFRDPRSEAEWPAVEARIAELGITSLAAGVNVGDRRAL